MTGINLTNIINNYKNTKFSWGELDCCIFTAGVVEEFTGRDLPYWKDMLNYTDKKSAVKTLRKLGCNKLQDLPTIILNKPKQSISKVKHGDVVYYVNEEGLGILGVCNGVRAYFLQVGGGLTARPIEDCLYCWGTN